MGIRHTGYEDTMIRGYGIRGYGIRGYGDTGIRG